MTNKEKMLALSAIQIFLHKQHGLPLVHTPEQAEKLIAKASELYGFDVLKPTEYQDESIINDLSELVLKLTEDLLGGE